MPRSVIVLGSSADLFGEVRGTLVPDGRFIDGGNVIYCDGVAAPLMNIYATDLDPAEWDGLDAPEGMPDPRPCPGGHARPAAHVDVDF